MRLSAGVCCSLLLSVSALGGRVDAAEVAPVDFSLDYRAADGCPNAAAFLSALQERLPGARRLATGESRERIPRLRVELRAAGGSEISEIAGDLPDGTRFQRRMVGARCADAMQSMAVIAAMALDDNLRRATDSAPSAPGDAAPPRKIATPEPAPGIAAAARPVAVTARHAASTSSNVPSQAGWQWATVAAAGIEGGVAPNVAPAFALGLELADSTPRGFAPSVRLSGLLAQSPARHVAPADVRFRLLAARLDLCPIQARGSGLAATACAEVDLGQLRGSAEHVPSAQPQTMLWFGLGLVGRARVALTSRFALELGASGRVLPVHDHFILKPARPLFEVPIITGDLLVGLAYSWR